MAGQRRELSDTMGVTALHAPQSLLNGITPCPPMHSCRGYHGRSFITPSEIRVFFPAAFHAQNECLDLRTVRPGKEETFTGDVRDAP